MRIERRESLATVAASQEELVAWCEANGVDFLPGLAKTYRLNTGIEERTRAGGSAGLFDVRRGPRPENERGP
jgi:hypothetical protein